MHTLPTVPVLDPAEPNAAPPDTFTPSELDQFHRDGYVVARGLVGEAVRRAMLEATLDGLARRAGPIEYEADLHYPGAPPSRQTEGGGTVRRLKQAHARDVAFTEWLARPELTGRMRQLLGPDLVVPLAHHNCVMTKHPRFSSDTGWHQDIRYWSFSRADLVSVWLALGEEHAGNGCLRLIPGTHRMTFDRGRFDDALFLRPELPENAELIAAHTFAELEAGDVLFFHCRTFHAASRNHGDRTKYSVVFTFRPAANPPIAGTRSASMPELLIPPT